MQTIYCAPITRANTTKIDKASFWLWVNHPLLQQAGVIYYQTELAVQEFSRPSTHYHTRQEDFKVFHYLADLCINIDLKGDHALIGVDP